jgi:ubiquinol-cytochrome c reductase cytochrome c1 subunit
VCSACHGMNRLAYRNLVGVAFTESEAKAIASEREAISEPDDMGVVKMRPAILSDYMISPYKNDNEARYNNNGSLPPDLSLIIKGRGLKYYYF